MGILWGKFGGNMVKRLTKEQRLEKNKKELIKWMKNQNKILKNWFIRNYGRKCPDYMKGCIVCEQWKLFDKLKYKEEDLK